MPVEDPDLQIRGEGGGHPGPEIRGGPGLTKIFSALRASFWPKTKGRADPPGPSPGSATACGNSLETSQASSEIIQKFRSLQVKFAIEQEKRFG